MSAIAGIYAYNDPSIVDPALHDMLLALRKYPADATREWQDGAVGFGCHLQWITPESVGELLPRYDKQYGIAMTADAIIDNREELFERLQVEPGRRSEITDSELIARAYREWGENAPRYLIGDFAFVLWDERRRLLFGARDLLGNRALYYRQSDSYFAFCTAIQPLLELPGSRKQLNEAWFAEFLAIPVVQDAVDVHATAYRGIELVPPAHSFTVKNGSVTLKQYDALVPVRERYSFRTDAEYEEAFADVFKAAVLSKLRTNREVGISLSGGLDSTAVAAFAAPSLRQDGKALHGFSYVPPPGFADWTTKRAVTDESPYIRATVDYVGNIKDRYLDFPERDSYGEIDDLLELMEGPYKFLENSFWLKGILESASESGVGVLLNGARGNYTVSWGPAFDYYARLMRRMRFVLLYRELKLYGRAMGIGRSRLLPAIGKLAFPVFAAKDEDVPPAPRLIHPSFAARTKVMDRLLSHDVGLPGTDMDEFEAREYQFRDLSVSNHQGTSQTKFSLRYRIWERDPTADPRVIRFCLGVPARQYVQNGIDRSLLRRALAGRLPDEVRMNQRVRGIQGADWIHRMKPNWKAFLADLDRLCRDSAASEYLNVAQIKESMSYVGTSPKPELAFDPHARLLMQSLIAYRFLRQFTG